MTCDLYWQVWIGVSDVFQQVFVFFANPRLDVVTGYVVPVDAVVVELVQNSQAVLWCSPLDQFAVVGLRLADAALFGPVVLVTLGGRSKFLQNRGPEPAVDLDGLEVRPFAALEVAETA